MPFATNILTMVKEYSACWAHICCYKGCDGLKQSHWYQRQKSRADLTRIIMNHWLCYEFSLYNQQIVRSFLSIATILNVTWDFCLLKQESDLGSEAWRGFVVVVGVRLLQPAQPRQLQLSVHGITIPDLRGILCKKKKRQK